jgi:hypothetical protein
VGFDNDPPSIFDDQIKFIRESGIISAMVGLLNAPTGTKLFKRLKNENRLLENFSGNNMDGTINFVPKMKYSFLMRGYVNILRTIYADKEYYKRVKTFLNNYNVPNIAKKFLTLEQLRIFIKLVWKLGFVDRSKFYFWKLFVYSLFKYPQKFVLAMTFAVYGFHYKKVVRGI